jgi:uncharacterized protein YciI
MRAVALAVTVLLASACRSSAPAAAPAPAAERHVFVIAALMAGHPQPAPSAADVEAATSGHFANMKRLSEAGQLLLAGPSGSAESEFRGIFLFDTASVERARELTASDPAVVAGLLRPELTTLSTVTDLRALPELVAVARAERVAADPADPAEGFVGRPYVLATTNRGAEVERVLRRMILGGRVLFHGELGPPAAPGTALFVLDVETLAGAERELTEAGAWRGLGAEWALDLWWASEAVARLPRGPAATGVARQP